MVTAAGDLKKLVTDTLPEMATKMANEWYANVERKALSGDEFGAAADSAELAADVAQVVVPIAGSGLAKLAPKAYNTLRSGLAAIANPITKTLARAGEALLNLGGKDSIRAGVEYLMSAGRGTFAESVARGATRAEDLELAAASGEAAWRASATEEVLKVAAKRTELAADLRQRAIPRRTRGSCFRC